MVRQSVVIPELKSRRGSSRGWMSRVESRFITATASWLTLSMTTSVKPMSFHSGSPSGRASDQNANVPRAVRPAIPPA